MLRDKAKKIALPSARPRSRDNTLVTLNLLRARELAETDSFTILAMIGSIERKIA